MAKMLSALSRQKGRSISDLVRESLQEKYMSGKALDKGALARQLTGLWEDRKDLENVDAVVRKLRSGKRLQRLGIDRDTA